MSKKPAADRKIPVDKSLLSNTDREELRKAALNAVTEEMSQDARDAFYAEEMARIRRTKVPADALLQVKMDMAPYVPFIMIDGVQFFHGYSYEVPQKQALVLYEQMQRSWHHQDEIDGRGKTEAYRRPSNRTLGPQHAGSPTRGINGPVTAEI